MPPTTTIKAALGGVLKGGNHAIGIYPMTSVRCPPAAASTAIKVSYPQHELQLPPAGKHNMHFTALYTDGEGIQLPAWKEINLGGTES